MSQLLTFSDIRNSRIPAVLEVCNDDIRLLQWLNTFQERASNLGRWWGTTRVAQFCISAGCLTLPREVATLELASLNGNPLRSLNGYYEFIRVHTNCSYPPSSCPEEQCNNGTCGCCGCGMVNIEDRNPECSFAKTTAVTQKIRTYPGNVADVGKTIIFQGYDANGIWVRTTVSGVRIDGEQVTLALPYVDTVTTWGVGAPTGVIKQATAYRVLVYSVDVSTGTEIQLAEYQPSETRPMYRVVQIPNFCSPTGTCETNTLKAVVSLQHIPIEADNDWLLFQNLAAYSDGMLSEKYREAGELALANAYMYGTPVPSRSKTSLAKVNFRGGAIPMLEAELRKMSGDKTSVRVGHSGVNLVGFR